MAWIPRTTSWLLILVMVFTASAAESKTVVMIPFPSTSHVRYHTNVARALAKLGHEVLVATPASLPQGVIDTTGFNTIVYETLPNAEEKMSLVLSGNYFSGKSYDVFEFLRICKQTVDAALSNDTLLEAIRKTRPDLIVIDNTYVYYGMSVIPYRLDVPFAFLGSVYYPTSQRIPFSPAETPFNLLPFSNKMTFVQRLTNTLTCLFYMVSYKPTLPYDLVATYAPEKPFIPLDMLVAQAQIWLVEIDHILDYPRPTMPNVKLIGGTATGPAKPLKAEWKAFMDGATKGVVVVSFGSSVLGMPDDITKKLFDVFLQLPMKVVFRSNLTSPDPAKVMTSTWLPQNDLLGHPNTKVFVSHCGKNGQYEALHHAVPIVAMPLFTDQFYNAERARSKGFAEVLDLRTCTPDELLNTILKVANDPSYKHAITKLSRLFKELYGLPLDKAAYWLDHVMEHGGEYMRSAGQEMPYYQFLLVDVLALLLAVVVAVLLLLCLCVRLCCRCCRRGKEKRE